MIYIGDDGALYQLDDSLSHHGVKGMKWGVRKDRKRIGYESREKVKRALKGISDKSKYAFKKVSMRVVKLANDPRVQIGAAAVTGIVAGVLGNMAVSNIAATTAFRKILSYGESQITHHMRELESDGYVLGEPTVNSFGQRSWKAYNLDDRSSVSYTQNLKTGSVTYNYTLPDGRSYSNGELLLPDELYD